MSKDDTPASGVTRPMKPLSTANRPRINIRPDYAALWLIALTSLALNLFTLRQLLVYRQLAAQAISDAIAVIDAMQGQTFRYTAVVENTITLDADLPINETVRAPINETLAINTVVTVPVDAGLLGIIYLSIPIIADVPVRLEPEIHIDQAFHVRAPVDVHLEVPLEIRIADTPMAATLSDLRARLIALAERLGGAPPATQTAPVEPTQTQ